LKLLNRSVEDHFRKNEIKLSRQALSTYFYLFRAVFGADGGQTQAVADRGLDLFFLVITRTLVASRECESKGAISQDLAYHTGYIDPFAGVIN
jgi:hypothetical protein